MSDDCRLTRADEVSVDLIGATIVGRARGIEVPSGWHPEMQLIEEGVQTRLRLAVCPGEAAGGDDLVASFGLPRPPAEVILEHADGEETFLFEANAPAASPPARSRGGVGRDAFQPESAAPRRYRAAPQRHIGIPRPRFDWIPWRRRSVGSAGPNIPRTPLGGGASPGDTDVGGRGQSSAWRPDADPGGGGGGSGGSSSYGHIDLGDSAAPDMVSGDEGFDIPAFDFEPDEHELANAFSPLTDEAERSALYARIDAPDRFVVGEPTEITLGVGPAPNPQVVGVAMTVPESAGERFILSAQLVADGFRRADGVANWHFDFAVTPEQPYPATNIDLIADPIEEELQIRRLRVVYSMGGQVIGIAERPVAVVAQASTEAPPSDAASFGARQTMAVPVSEDAADLTVVILQDPEAQRGHLVWTLNSPHQAVDVPRGELVTDIGHSPEEFANAVRIQVDVAEATPGQPLLRETLLGIGGLIASQVPATFWAAFKAVAEAVGDRAPTVLILSQEPYVPWELAAVPDPPESDAPPFLGARAITGRWVFGQDKPKYPPPDAVAMRGMAVVYGNYAGNAQLEDALAEKAELEAQYQAVPVRATLEAMRELLRGQPPGEVLHFAIHGRFASGASGGLLMEDGASLSPFAVGGSNLGSAPLVFLNACQVGAGTQLLGDYAGMAEAFLRAGASAVIAPLWSVRDGAAKDIALRFYPAALDGELPAELLRRERASFGAGGDPTTATHVAYLFYGHPGFRLSTAA